MNDSQMIFSRFYYQKNINYWAKTLNCTTPGNLINELNNGEK